MLYPIDTIRKDFPILHQNIQGHSLVYLDNAATTQKPKIVIDAISKYYEEYNANIHRGIHTLAEKATLAFEETRQSIQNFIHASSLEEIIFVKGTTEGINLVASSFGKKFIEQGDEIIISTLEHHSNIVPWQLLCEEKGAILRVIPIHETGELDYEAFEKLLNKKTKLVSIVHISNALGTINPIEKIITAAHQVGAKVFIDGAQSAAHIAIDVQKLDCDFYVF
jgi:cysteine desulfurase/selenocysteine lyase